MANLKIDLEIAQDEMMYFPCSMTRKENVKLSYGMIDLKKKIKKLEEEKENNEEKVSEKNAEEKKEEENKKNWIIIKKEKDYKEGKEVSRMIQEMIGSAEWTWEKTRNRDVEIIKFRREIDKKFLWKRRIEILKRGYFVIDELLDEEERTNRRHMLDKARKLREEGKRVVVKNRKMKIDEKWYEVKNRLLEKMQDKTYEDE